MKKDDSCMDYQLNKKDNINECDETDNDDDDTDDNNSVCVYECRNTLSLKEEKLITYKIIK